uniref:Uncharacterized protein n=1 Tax=Lactuca sativa TaxID=4236 RepID=A0A9R1X7W6_LACSA|nr:hypothetical protein LSAT_V11C500265640 [Lactuca sativa]
MATRCESFSRIIFGFLLDIQSNVVLSLDGINRLYFKLRDTKMVCGREEFCVITRFTFVNNTLLVANDDDGVRACLIYVLCQGFLGKQINDLVYKDWFFLAKNVDDWNILDILSNTRCQDLQHQLGAIKKLKWVDVKKNFDVTKEGRKPRYKMIPSEEETRKSYYYMYGEPTLVPSSVRKRFWRKEESSSNISSIGRSEARSRQSGKLSIQDPVNQIIALEEWCF